MISKEAHRKKESLSSSSFPILTNDVATTTTTKMLNIFRACMTIWWWYPIICNRWMKEKGDFLNTFYDLFMIYLNWDRNRHTYLLPFLWTTHLLVDDFRIVCGVVGLCHAKCDSGSLKRTSLLRYLLNGT